MAIYLPNYRPDVTSTSVKGELAGSAPFCRSPAVLSVSEYSSRTSSSDNTASSDAKKAKVNGDTGGVPNIGGIASPLRLNCRENGFGRSVLRVGPLRKDRYVATRSLFTAVTENHFMRTHSFPTGD